MLVAIHQPNFLPHFGYFKKMVRAQVFIFLDDVQYSKGGYSNRVKININGVGRWITQPIKHIKSFEKINDIYFDGSAWKESIIVKIKTAYFPSAYYVENIKFISNLILETSSDNLSKYNAILILGILKYLNIYKIYEFASTFNITKKATEKLIDLIVINDGTTYLSGAGGDNYQDKELFAKANIGLQYNDYEQLLYEQPYTRNFIPGLSIIDTLFNIGKENLRKELLK